MASATPDKAEIDPESQVCVLDRRTTMLLWIDRQVEAGKVSAAEAEVFATKRLDAWLASLDDSPSDTLKAGKDFWDTLRDVKDIRVLAKDVGWLGKYYLKEYKGVKYIILKGHAARRAVLTGTRYGLENAKVLAMKLGPAAIKVSKKNVVVNFVFCTAANIVDYVVNDRMTLFQLFGGIASDVSKCLLAAGAGAAAGALVVGGAAVVGVSVIAVGPLIVALVVGYFVGEWLDDLFKKYKIEERLSQLFEDAYYKMREVRRRLEANGRALWNDVANSGVITDLSREADELVDDVSRGFDRLRWRFQKMF